MVSTIDKIYIDEQYSIDLFVHYIMGDLCILYLKLHEKNSKCPPDITGQKAENPVHVDNLAFCYIFICKILNNDYIS